VRTTDFLTSVKWNGYVLLFDCSILLISGVFLTQGIGEIFQLLPTLLLIEAAVIFLIGSSFEFSSSIFFSKVREYLFRSDEKWSVENYNKSRRKALPFFLVGLLLFVESLVLSFVFT